MSSAPVRPNRELGQHFLVDENILGVIARLAALSTGGMITLADYQASTGASSAEPTTSQSTTEHADTGDEHHIPVLDARNGPSLKEQVEAFERGLVARALDATGGNQSEAARRLGVSRVTLIDKMKKYGLEKRGR